MALDLSTDPEKDKDTGLPLDFYGKSYLGKDVHVGVQGESPTASAAGATPTGALGVGPTGAGTGPTGATSAAPATGAPSTGLQTALEAVGLTKNVADVAGSKSGDSSKDTSGTGSAPFTAEKIKGLQPTVTEEVKLGFPEGMSSTSIPPEDVSSVVPTGEAAVASDAGSAAAPALAAAAAAQEAAKLAGAKIPAPVTAGEAALNLGTASLPSAIGPLAKGKISALDVGGLATGLSGLTSGIESLFGFGGKPPAGPFPANTWSSIHEQVSKAVPKPIPITKDMTPDQAEAVQNANDVIKNLTDYTSATQPDWLTRAGPQSAETWNNILGQITQNIQGWFTQLQDLYPKALQASQPAPSPAKPSAPTTQVLPGSFSSGEHKLPDAGQ